MKALIILILFFGIPIALMIVIAHYNQKSRDAYAKRLMQMKEEAWSLYNAALERLAYHDKSYNQQVYTLECGRKAYATSRLVAGQGNILTHIDETSIANDIATARNSSSRV